jgi:hypothetical protein
MPWFGAGPQPVALAVIAASAVARVNSLGDDAVQ